eukprot:gene5878-biopygen2023
MAAAASYTSKKEAYADTLGTTIGDSEYEQVVQPKIKKIISTLKQRNGYDINSYEDMNTDDLLSFLQWLIRHEPRLNSVDQWSSGKPEDGAWRLVALGKVWSDKDSQPSIDDAGLPPSTAPPPPSTPKNIPKPTGQEPGTVAKKKPPAPPAAAAAAAMPPPAPRGQKQQKPKSKNGPTPPPKRRQKDDDTMDEDAFDRAQAERARADAATQERIAEEQRLEAVRQQRMMEEQRAKQAQEAAQIAEQQKRYAQLSQQLNAVTQQALAPFDQEKFNREKPQRDAIRNEIIKIKQWLAATTGDILPVPSTARRCHHRNSKHSQRNQ